LASDGLSLAGQLVDQVAQGHCYQALGGCALVEADYQQALAHYEAALINFAQSGKTYQAGRCMNRIAETYLITNRFELALACLREAQAYAKAGGHQDVLVASLYVQARVRLFSGDFAQAAASVKRALDLSESAGLLQVRPEGYGLYCLIHLWSGDLERAKESHQQAWAALIDHQNEQAVARTRYHQGLLQLAAGDPAGAIESLSAAGVLDGRHEIERLGYLAEAHRALNQADVALQRANEAVNLLSARNNGLEACQRIYLNHYSILRTAGQYEAAGAALKTARDLVARQSAGLARAARGDFLAGLPWNREIAALSPVRDTQPQRRTG
jgi:tetratricopeptide (TPR) repeat protein